MAENRDRQIDFNTKIYRLILVMPWLKKVCPCIIDLRFQSESGWYFNRHKAINGMTFQAMTQTTNMVLTPNGDIIEGITVGSVILARIATYPKDQIGVIVPIFMDYHPNKFNQSALPVARDPERGSPIYDDVFTNPKKYMATLNFVHEQYQDYIIILAYGGDLEKDKGKPGFIVFHNYNVLRDNGAIALFKSDTWAKEKRRNHALINVENCPNYKPADDNLRKKTMVIPTTIQQDFLNAIGSFNEYKTFS
jgi:hypothetical protein